MRFILIFILFIIYAQAQTILVINSNYSISKYKQTQEAFAQNFDEKFKSIDISSMTPKEIKDYLYNEYPDIVYTIGSRAYQYAYKYIPEKKIFFSSIVNWKRLPKKEHFSGVLVELHSGMFLTMIRSMYKKFKKLGIIYSEYTKDVVSSLEDSSKHVGLKIITQKISSKDDIKIDSLLKQTDGLIIIPDPIVLGTKDVVIDIFTRAKAYKNPIIAYDKLFINYGAVLSISVDNPTIGRQIATMIKGYMKKTDTHNIQYPTGTHVTFNKKSAKELELDLKNIEFINIDEIVE